VDLHRASLRKLRRQGAIFASVGVIVLVVYTGLTALLAGPVGLPFQIALALSYGSALALNFTLHRTFTFATDEGYALRLPGQVSRFLALALFQYVVTALAVAFLPDALGLPEFAVWAAVMATFAIGNFVALRLTTFHPR
jgi:putative flippase GtrA